MNPDSESDIEVESERDTAWPEQRRPRRHTHVRSDGSAKKPPLITTSRRLKLGRRINQSTGK
ncbi:hypothetical protein TSOC_013941, partial [Tetrabaena socialis]